MLLRDRFLKSKKDADEKRRLQELRDKELISKADVLKERIMGRRKTKKNVSRLAEAGMKALVSNLKSKGHTFNTTEVALNEKPKIQDMKKRAQIWDVLISQDTISRGITDCAKMQMEMELEMKRNEGIAKPHIRANLPKAMGLYERVSRLRRLANEKKKETLKDSGENRDKGTGSTESTSSSYDRSRLLGLDKITLGSSSLHGRFSSFTCGDRVRVVGVDRSR